MNAFISYSHHDSLMLEILHKHLAQLKRDNVIKTWTDHEIPAGGNLNQHIAAELENAQIFIALLSPDYIASNYCYEKEFHRALELEHNGKVVIVPVILEPCDWQSTPFATFKALPRDGKAVSTWDNKNTAFLDIAQNLRKLSQPDIRPINSHPGSGEPPMLSRNYRVKKAFDTLQRIEFIEKSFREVKDLLNRYIDEIVQIDNIKARTITDKEKEYEFIIVNRNMVNTEAHLRMFITADESVFHSYQTTAKQITYMINEGTRNYDRSFTLVNDDYEMFWRGMSQTVHFYNHSENNNLGSKEIADIIWSECLNRAGIM